MSLPYALQYYVPKGLGIPANPFSAYTASWLLPICHVRDPALRSFPLSLIFLEVVFREQTPVFLVLHYFMYTVLV